MTIDEIKFNYRIEEVIGRTISLKQQGPELVGNCIFHNDEHASLKVNPRKQIFKCFACDTSGDMFDFFEKQGIPIKEAKSIITNGQTNMVNMPARVPDPPAVIWKNATPDQTKLPDVANLIFKDYGKPSAYWTYHNAISDVIGYVLRFDLPEGKKDVIPYTYNTDGNKYAWKWRGFDLPRPLYNLPELYLRPNAIVLVVEGEKACDAAKKLFPQYVCVTWCGGKDNVKSADWSPLQGRNVFLWGDNDLAGVLAMFGGWEYNEKTNVYKRFKGVCEYVTANFKRIQNSPEFPKKWDVADSTWTPEEATEYLKANRIDIPAVSEFPPNEQPATPLPVAPPPPIEAYVTPAPSIPIPVSSIPDLPAEDDEIQVKNPYFKCLGFENNETNLYVFFVYRTNTIVKLSAGGINISNLLQLAPLNYWEGTYPKPTARSGSVKFEINTVADHLITVSVKKGIFNPTKIRGRGAWIDNGVPVIHCGDTLIVNGVKTAFAKHQSRYIYEAGQELGFELTKPLQPSDANKLIQLLERLNWERDINARLLAGWIVIAPLCGALSWRSHMWLTGSAGSGKSEIMKLFIKKFLGQMFVDAQGETTEAGIRQYLKADALPVVFDEAESEDKKSSERMQSVLGIMRASSTSDGGKIIKGSSSGAAFQFNIRSCFAFASIGANLTQRSDVSRITVLEIKPDMRPDKKKHWQETLDFYYSVVTEEFVKAFQSRAVMLMPTILANAKTFSNAAASELDNQRTGDQLGALLAGSYSLYSDNLISYEDAKKWIKERDWSEERLSESTRDEIKVLHKIMDSEIRVETTLGDKTRTVGELIIAARGDIRDALETGLISQERAIQVLKRIGIAIEGKHALFSDQSQFIKKVLYNTPYDKNYHTILSRVDNAVKVDNVMFGSHVKARATKIDTAEIFGPYNVEAPKPVKPIENTNDYKQEEINFKNN